MSYTRFGANIRRPFDLNKATSAVTCTRTHRLSIYLYDRPNHNMMSEVGSSANKVRVCSRNLTLLPEDKYETYERYVFYVRTKPNATRDGRTICNGSETDMCILEYV